ncbi:MAG: 50S ribosomal protein L35ae [Candidatus Bathyarchaeia archaeon]
MLTVQRHGVVVNFRIGPKTQKNKECLVKIPDIDNDTAASRYIGRKVVWLSQKSGKKIVGEVVDIHGRNGMIRVRFRRALPGEALGAKVAIL